MDREGDAPRTRAPGGRLIIRLAAPGRAGGRHLRQHPSDRGPPNLRYAPDVFVVLPSNPVPIEDYADYAGAPDLAVEVLSGDVNSPNATTRSHARAARLRDTDEKRRRYAERGIPHYWIADPDTGRVRWLRLEGGVYQDVGRAPWPRSRCPGPWRPATPASAPRPPRPRRLCDTDPPAAAPGSKGAPRPVCTRAGGLHRQADGGPHDAFDVPAAGVSPPRAAARRPHPDPLRLCPDAPVVAQDAQSGAFASQLARRLTGVHPDVLEALAIEHPQWRAERLLDLASDLSDLLLRYEAGAVGEARPQRRPGRGRRGGERVGGDVRAPAGRRGRGGGAVSASSPRRRTRFVCHTKQPTGPCPRRDPFWPGHFTATAQRQARWPCPGPWRRAGWTRPPTTPAWSAARATRPPWWSTTTSRVRAGGVAVRGRPVPAPPPAGPRPVSRDRSRGGAARCPLTAGPRPYPLPQHARSPSPASLDRTPLWDPQPRTRRGSRRLERKRAYAAANRERINAQVRARYHADPEPKRAANWARRRAEDPEVARAKRREYRLRDGGEALRRAQRRWKAEHPERVALHKRQEKARRRARTTRPGTDRGSPGRCSGTTTTACAGSAACRSSPRSTTRTTRPGSSIPPWSTTSRWASRASRAPTAGTTCASRTGPATSARATGRSRAGWTRRGTGSTPALRLLPSRLPRRAPHPRRAVPLRRPQRRGLARLVVRVLPPPVAPPARRPLGALRPRVGAPARGRRGTLLARGSRPARPGRPAPAGEPGAPRPPDGPDDPLGRAVRRLRQHRGWTYRDLASRAGPLDWLRVQPGVAPAQGQRRARAALLDALGFRDEHEVFRAAEGLGGDPG